MADRHACPGRARTQETARKRPAGGAGGGEFGAKTVKRQKMSSYLMTIDPQVHKVQRSKRKREESLAHGTAPASR